MLSATTVHRLGRAPIFLLTTTTGLLLIISGFLNPRSKLQINSVPIGGCSRIDKRILLTAGLKRPTVKRFACSKIEDRNCYLQSSRVRWNATITAVYFISSILATNGAFRWPLALPSPLCSLYVLVRQGSMGMPHRRRGVGRERRG